MKLLGTIEQCGPYIALRTSPTCYYPLGGNSGIASDFREAFNDPAPHDIGKRLYRHSAGHLCLESAEQVAALATIWRDTHPDYRGHDADGDKSIMLNASEGGGLCKLSALTGEQIRARVPDYKG